MIQIIAGKKGSGKTKRIIDMTNEKAKTSQHDVVFIDDDNRYIFDIDHSVRFINASEYAILTPEMFLGFLCGMLSQNFDVGVIFIDAFKKLLKTCLLYTSQTLCRQCAVCLRTHERLPGELLPYVHHILSEEGEP